MCLGGISLFSKIVNKQLKTENKLTLHLPKTFWLFLHRVRNAYFQSYSQKKFQILIWVTK